MGIENKRKIREFAKSPTNLKFFEFF